jgi:hypothetical protein
MRSRKRVRADMHWPANPLASIEAAFLPKLQEMAQQIGRGLAD